MAAASKPTYATVSDKFYWQGPDGEVVLPLNFKTKLYKELVASSDDVLGQFLFLVGRLDMPDLLEQLDELNLTESAKLADEWSDAFRTFQGASLGESRGSSTS